MTHPNKHTIQDFSKDIKAMEKSIRELAVKLNSLKKRSIKAEKAYEKADRAVKNIEKDNPSMKVE